MLSGFNAQDQINTSRQARPGICDFHVHVGERIGGYDLRDSFAALDKIALRCGVSAIGVFVTEEVGLSLSVKLRSMHRDAQRNFHGHVHWHLTPVSSTLDEVYPLLKQGCDLKFYTTYKSAGLFSSYERIGQWMRDLSDIKPRILVHCEDDAVVEQFSATHLFKTPFDHTLRRPEAAEIKAVDQVLNLAVKYSHPVHIVHVSTPAAAILISQAKAHAPFITCETTPHYLLYNEDKLKGENAHRLICTPPFRKESSRGMLVELLQDGVFDIIATDHCAFRQEDKDRFQEQPEKVPCGIPGLETMYSSLYQGLVVKEMISRDHLDRLCCHNPARLMGIGPEPVDGVIRKDNLTKVME
jgi:dihydropyrimidinase